MLVPEEEDALGIVHWQLVVTAKNYFKRKKTIENYSFEIIIVNEIGMEINV